MPPPEKLSVVYASDESVAVRASGDFVNLAPDWQKLAWSNDGVIDSGLPWVLTSETVNFEGNGVIANHVIQLVKFGTLRGSGDLLAVESVDGTSITLRRIGADVGVGQPPIATTGIEFLIATLDPQLEEASFDLNRRFGIDANLLLQSPTRLYDSRDLRQATILTVLRDRFVAECRTKDGDFWAKVTEIKEELDAVLARLQVRWIDSTSDTGQPITTSLSSGARITR